MPSPTVSGPPETNRNSRLSSLNVDPLVRLEAAGTRRFSSVEGMPAGSGADEALPEEARATIREADIVVDGLLGIGGRPGLRGAIERAADVDGDGRYGIDYRIAQPDGSYRWLRAWGKAEFEGEGAARRAVRIVGASRDVTAEIEAQHRRADELVAARQLQAVSAELISEQEPDALYEKLLDAAMVVMHADGASVQILDPEGAPVAGVGFEIVSTPDTTDFPYQRSGVSGLDGSRTFTDVPVGVYDLVVTSATFGLMRKVLIEHLGQQKAKRFLLSPSWKNERPPRTPLCNNLPLCCAEPR